MNATKLFLLPVVLLIGLCSTVQAQKLKNFLDNKDSSFTWLGVDFTQARLIGDGAARADDIVGRHFAGINDVIMNEPKKYDVPGAFRRDKVTYDISFVNEHNEKTNPDNLKSSNTADFERLKPEDVTKLVKGYNFNGKKGIGVMFVMDGMSKSDKAASMYVTVIDMGTRNVLMAERYSGKAQGFGFRNYWAYTVHKVLDDLYSDYNKLKTKYADAKDPEEERPAQQPKKESKPAMAKKPKKKNIS
ncbi:hypothetical protein [Chitinophaga vietnamensis]|uniref:hypothetical protein n=1 Tax=Chitinophaga vietnamensis TaxID=2593957 RepID=UPI001178521E|nr:hypothetical protein [Chitinophaga vietnamensis]